MTSHISFGKGNKSIAILIPTKDMEVRSLTEHYIQPLSQLGVPKDQIIALDLLTGDKGKPPTAAVIKPFLVKLEKMLRNLEIEHVLICDSTYFKSICKVAKSDVHYGYPVKTIWPGITGFLCPNYRALFYNPAMNDKIKLGVQALSNVVHNVEGLFQRNLVKDCKFPTTNGDICQELNRLVKIPQLTCDIETYSLKVNEAKIATIAFGENQTQGTAFPVGPNRVVRKALLNFFEKYQGTLIFHNATFDTKILIWELFMQHPRDYTNMLRGLHLMHRKLHDTKILAYLALNSTAGPSLKLKELAFEFAGNYALDDMSNIVGISLAGLLEYNAIDALATWYVHDKYHAEVMATQKSVYQKVFLPSLKTITQMELCGMPINLGKVLNAEHLMDDISKQHHQSVMSNQIILGFQDVQRQKEADKANLKLKKLRKTKEDFLGFSFNPGSNPQLAHLLYEHLGLPVIELTDAGKPSTKAEVLKSLSKLIARTTEFNQAYIPLLEDLVSLSEVNKILNTFIPAFKNNSITKDGWQYLHGSFNLGGTKSGRLSSSDPNLTNIPSTGTKYAKAVKECFQAPIQSTEIDPNGWLMVGADFNGLEDRVSALQTKDPNKLAIFIQGYDGHCLRAYAYFGDQMVGIDPEDVSSINSISKKYPHLRQLSKSPTFALTYMGTYKTLMKTFGFTEEMAKQIEANYHQLYRVSDEWVQARIKEAQKTGYVELAFGLRLRTPMLPQVILESEALPYQVHKEIKTAGNALGQSYGLLNSNSANLFMQRVWKSEYATSVLPISQIHDSQYYMIRNNLGCLKWVNDNLIQCMKWNKLPAIQHPVVKLEASLELYYPDWSQPISIPNKLSLDKLGKHLKFELTKRSAG